MVRNRKWTAMLLALALALSLVTPAAVADEPESSQHRITFGNSYIQFEKADILPYGKDNMLVFSLKVYNGGSSSLSFNDYFLRVRSQSGERFDLKRFDTETNTITARSEKEYRYYANTKSVRDISELVFSLIRWDLSNIQSGSYERLVGEMVIPKSDFAPVPAGQSGTFDIDHIRAEAQIDRLLVREDDDEYKVSIDLSLKNIASQSIPYPQLEYQIVTGNGMHFPLSITRQDPADLLRAQEEAEVDLEGNVPNSVDLQNSVLLMTRSLQSPEGVPISETIARFRLPEADPSAYVPLGEEQIYTNKNGKFSISLEQIYRLPWEDDDMINADFRIANADDKPLTLPGFAGHFKLDGNITVQANGVVTDRTIALQPGESATVHLIGNIPYTYTFSELDIVLQEREVTANGERLRDVFHFVHDTNYSTIVHVDTDETFLLDKTGRQYEISVYDVTRFENPTSDIFSMLLAFDNKERRLAQVPEFSGQLELADGTVYPVTVIKPQEKTAPGGITLVELRTPLPKRADTTGAKLLLGEAIADGMPAQPSQPADSYVNPVSFAAQSAESEPADSLEQIELAPYTLTIDNVRTPYIYFNEVTFRFNYELSKDLLMDANRSQDRFRIELEDAKGKVWLERDFAIESPGDNPNQMYFEIGSDKVEIVEIFDSTSFNMNRFTMNVYHVTGSDHKHLLASKEFSWKQSN